MALAGGVSHRVPQQPATSTRRRDPRRPTATAAPSTRAAQGTVRGSGVGVVVLKRLGDALADGDTIHAVIRGSAINNDGSAQGRLHGAERRGPGRGDRDGAGDGRRRRPETIGYVEAHGTGTALGDPDRDRARSTQAFRADATDAQGFCAIGSVKTNIGHLDAAAGVAGLIKAVAGPRARRDPAEPALRGAQPARSTSRAARSSSNTRLSEWPAGRRRGAPA